MPSIKTRGTKSGSVSFRCCVSQELPVPILFLRNKASRLLPHGLKISKTHGWFPAACGLLAWWARPLWSAPDCPTFLPVTSSPFPEPTLSLRPCQQPPCPKCPPSLLGLHWLKCHRGVKRPGQAGSPLRAPPSQCPHAPRDSSKALLVPCWLPQQCARRA